jgi:LacI family transcriptional regulator
MSEQFVPPSGPVTIADVARAVGVATSTVSRALTKPGRVSEATRLRVAAAANELGYYPNPQARSLTSGRTQSIALLVPDITNPFFFGLIRGTQSQAKARGYRQILVDTEESAGVEAGYLAELPNSVDGLVLAASRLSDDDLTTAAERVPIVTINRNIPSVPATIIDTPAAMGQVVDHLESLGHHSIAFLSGPASSWSSQKRWRALQTIARARGLRCEPAGPFPPTVQAGAAAADAAIHLGVTACIAFNDLIAIGALRRFAERGMSVPGDMSVVGCDDIFGADFCNPPLTTLTAPIEQAGRVATDMLFEQIAWRTSGLVSAGTRLHERLPTYLTIRESTGPVRSGS